MLPAELTTNGTTFYLLVVEDARTGLVEVVSVRLLDGGPFRTSVELGAPRRVHLFAYRSPPDALGLAVGPLEPAGEDEPAVPLPAPDAAWTSEVGDAESLTWVKTEATDTTQLAFRMAAPDPCTAFAGVAQPWMIDALPMTDLLTVLPLSESRLLLGGTRLQIPPLEAVLGAADFLEQYSPFPASFQGHEVRSLVRSGSGVFGVTNRELFELDPSMGRLVRTSTLPDGAWELSVGAEGSGIVFDRLAHVARWVELGPLHSRPMELPQAFETMTAVSATRVFASAGHQVHLFDGVRWSLDANLDNGVVGRFFTDGSQVGLILSDQVVFLRRMDGRWEALPLATRAIGQLGFGAFLARGRIILAGMGGTTFGWTGSKWCDILTGVQRQARGVSVSPDREVGFVYSFAENEQQRAPVVRITPRP